MKEHSFLDLFIFVFYFGIVNSMINYIISSLFFVKPMRDKYKIMASGLSNNIKDRYNYILFDILVICFYFYIIFFISKVFLSVIVTIHFIITLYYFNKYRKWDIVEYVNYFSEDLFDWDKIYTLKIPEDVKRNCFAIHNKNYDDYKDIYIRHLEMKQYLLQSDIDDMKK